MLVIIIKSNLFEKLFVIKRYTGPGWSSSANRDASLQHLYVRCTVYNARVVVFVGNVKVAILHGV